MVQQAMAAELHASGRRSLMLGLAPIAGQASLRELRQYWRPLGVGPLPEHTPLGDFVNAWASSAPVVGCWADM